MSKSPQYESLGKDQELQSKIFLLTSEFHLQRVLASEQQKSHFIDSQEEHSSGLWLHMR